MRVSFAINPPNKRTGTIIKGSRLTAVSTEARLKPTMRPKLAPAMLVRQWVATILVTTFTEHGDGYCRVG